MSIRALSADTQPSLEELCDGIRRNDPSITKVEIHVHDHTERRALLDALQQRNTTVTRLVLTVNEYLSAKCDLSALCRYLEQCESVRAIEFTCSEPRFEFCGELFVPVLHALIQNPSLLLVKFQSNVLFPCSELDAFLQAKSHCLKHLIISGRGCDWGGFARAEFQPSVRRTALSVGSLSVLEQLYFPELLRHAADYVLELFHLHPYLRKLSLAGSQSRQKNRDTIDALSSLLHSGVSIESLALEQFTLDTEMVRSLVRGLGSCHTLAKLTVDLQCVDNSGASELANCLGSSQSIQHLCLFNSYVNVRLAISMAASVLKVAGQESYRIGSSLRVLDIDCALAADDVQQVLRMLTKNECRLLSLTLSRLAEPLWLQVIQYLPQILRLRELILGCVGFWRKAGRRKVAILQAMHRNGSLHQLSFFTIHRQRRAFNFEGEPIRAGPTVCSIQSRVDRNNMAPRLLQNPYVADIGTVHDNLHTPLHLVPSLCRVVTQMPRTASTMLLAGLLTCEDAVRPSCRKCNGAVKQGRSHFD
jgi:hypothetical protein